MTLWIVIQARMALVCTRNEQVGAHFPHHHPQFNIDEDALPRCAALHVLYALQSLAAEEWAQSLVLTGSTRLI